MLGKQWLNRYASTNKRGSAVERSQNRQQKLDGIVAWYFNHVMESLPLMLQGGLLLLGCALSRYLWDISIVVASVVIAVTSFGVVFYLFIIVAGTASESCPYQTPGSHILRHLGRRVWSSICSTPSLVASVPSVVTSAFRNVFGKSLVIEIVAENACCYLWYIGGIIPFLRDLIIKLPRGFAVDVYRLGQAVIRVLFVLVRSMHSALKRRLGQRASPDFRCVSWTLQTSLDKPVHLTTSEHLATITDLTGMDPTIVVDFFNVFIGCISISGGKWVVLQGLERLAMVSVGCFLRTFHYLWVTDPASGVLIDLRRRYHKVFALETNFSGLPFHHTIQIIHALAHECWDYCSTIQWDDYKPSGQELIPLAQHIAKVVQVEYQRTNHQKVPRWILRFALHVLSLDPQAPASAIADCLMIAGTELQGSFLNTVTLDGRCAKI